MYYILAFCISFFLTTADLRDPEIFVKFRGYENFVPVCFGLKKQIELKKKITEEQKNIIEACLEKKIKHVKDLAHHYSICEEKNTLVESAKYLEENFGKTTSKPIEIMRKKKSRSPLITAGDLSFDDKDLKKQIDLQFTFEE